MFKSKSTFFERDCKSTQNFEMAQKNNFFIVYSKLKHQYSCSLKL